MSIYNRVMGNPWVYEKVRPWFVGGVNYDDIYQWMELTPDDILLDIGCGMGHAMEFIERKGKPYHSYFGYDVDQRAIDTFREKHPSEKIQLFARVCLEPDVRQIRPTKALAIGLLHHLTDDEVLGLLSAVHSTGTVKKLITLDTVYLPGKWLNNALASMDRGRHVRDIPGYMKLIEQSGFQVEKQTTHESGNGIATYYAMCLAPKKN